jgi:hypothetical protein
VPAKSLGFAPAGATPVEDFVAKFEAVKYVVDPATEKVKTDVFTNGQDLRIVSGALIVANPLTLGSLRPLARVPLRRLLPRDERAPLRRSG